MRQSLIAIAVAALAAPTMASAEVVDASPTFLTVRQSLALSVPPARAYAAFAEVSRWWSKDHTYSGNAANLTLDLRPGGCFCERLGTGGIEHLRVVLAWPGKRLVLSGLLGPTLYQATGGVMDVDIKKAGTGTALTITYRIGGMRDAEGAKLARQVDTVLAEQFRRYKAHVEKR
jgi:hypothetical protein